MAFKIVTWNVNGIRSLETKNKQGQKLTDVGVGNVGHGNVEPVLATLLREIDPDVLALQETRCPAGTVIPSIVASAFKYKIVLESKARKGYAGVGVFSKELPVARHFLSDEDEDDLNVEGRLLCLEYERFVFLNAYVPNSKQDLVRLPYRVGVWEVKVREFINRVKAITGKPVVAVADWNVAHTEMDIYNKCTRSSSFACGFTQEERDAYGLLMTQCDLKDAFRELHPNDREYTWFSNFGKSREKNNGWRIDGPLISSNLLEYVTDVEIHKEYYGSDHVPVLISFKIL